VLVEPAYRTHPEFTATVGDEVAELCELADYTPDPEQRLALDLIFALDRFGKSAAFEIGVVCARQNMKTGTFKQAALGWLYITDQQLVVWSAHEFSTTQEAFRDMATLIESNRYLERRVKRIYRGNGDESIELLTGQRMLFKARTKTGGRGLTGDKVVLDEAFALQPDHLGSLMPTLSVRPDPQLLYGSSAGLARSEVLRRIRDRGRAGTSSRLAWLEWCARRDVSCDEAGCRHEPGTDGCVLDRRDLWRQANPLLGRVRDNGTTLTEDYIAAEREAMPPEEFARERLGWWDDPAAADPAFGPGFWELCVTQEKPNVPPGGFAVAVSFDLTRASIVAAARDGDIIHGRPLHHAAGTGWVIEAAAELYEQHQLPFAVDKRGPAALLIEPLKKAGVELEELDTRDVLDACALLFDTVRERNFRHMAYPELDAAVAAAVKRPVGDRWAWGRRTSAADISPLEGVTLAAWQVSGEPETSVYESRGLEVV
jgi:hypothetical protein